jgi:hypothetical protein
MKLETRIYALALHLYPTHFRQKHGQDMFKTYSDALHHAKEQHRTLRFHTQSILDLIFSVLRSHLETLNSHSSRIAKVFLIVSSLGIALSGLIQTLSIWFEQFIHFPITIKSGDVLEPRVAIWWTIQQWNETLYSGLMLLIIALVLSLGIMGVNQLRHGKLERRWNVSFPMVMGLALVLTFYVITTTHTPLSLTVMSAIFSLEWAVLGIGLCFKRPTLQSNILSDLPR